MWPFGSDSGSPASSSIPFTHTVSNRASRLTIKINRKGQVIVVTPRFIPWVVIEAFVTQHQDWIETHLKAFKKTAQKPGKLTIYGKEYEKVVKYMPTQKLGIIIKGSEVIFNTPEAITPKSGQTTDDSAADTTNSSTANQECTILWGRKHEQALERFLKSSAETYVITRTAQLAEKMNTAYGRVTMREQSSRWGSCSSAGNLNFNWRLVHATPKIIDYVIIHELAHRTHMDHSKRFWDLVALYDPDYQLHRGWLKRQGHSLS